MGNRLIGAILKDMTLKQLRIERVEAEKNASLGWLQVSKNPQSKTWRRYAKYWDAVKTLAETAISEIEQSD